MGFVITGAVFGYSAFGLVLLLGAGWLMAFAALVGVGTVSALVLILRSVVFMSKPSDETHSLLERAPN